MRFAASEKTALRKQQKTDMLRGSGPVAAGSV
jgi:hypothetical protein